MRPELGSIAVEARAARRGFVPELALVLEADVDVDVDVDAVFPASSAGVRRGKHVTHRQRLTLLAAILGSGVATLDGTIVNVALPAIERDLGGGLTAQQWVVNAYLLALGSLILIGGSLGRHLRRAPHLHGRRGRLRVFSVACALAPTIGVLIAARTLQGAAAALLTPSSLAIIIGAFSTQERGPAIGSWTAWSGIAAVIGPLAGGVIVDQVSWRWVFALNVPLVAATIVLVLAAVPRTPTVADRRIDVLGALLCATGLGGIVFALIEQPRLAGRVLPLSFRWLEALSRSPGFSPMSATPRSRCSG